MSVRPGRRGNTDHVPAHRGQGVLLPPWTCLVHERFRRRGVMPVPKPNVLLRPYCLAPDAA
eukprot:2168879-Heterocapsa_arctica.AAC.1